MSRLTFIRLKHRFRFACNGNNVFDEFDEILGGGLRFGVDWGEILHVGSFELAFFHPLSVTLSR